MNTSSLEVRESNERRRENPQLEKRPVDDPFVYDPHEGTGPLRQSRSNRFSAFPGLSAYVEPLVIYKWRLIGCMVLAILLGWAVLLFYPRSYESTAKLRLSVGRDSVGLDPSSTTSQTLMFQKTQEEDINSALEILGSRDTLVCVVDELGAENILNGSLPNENPRELTRAEQKSIDLIERAKSLFQTAFDMTGVRDPISDHERAVLELRKYVRIYSPKKSSVMIVETESKTPEMAQAITRSIIDHFLQQHVDITTTGGSLNFFVQQSEEMEEKLNEMLEKKTKMLQTNRIASVASKHEALTKQFADIDSQILVAEGQLRRTEAEIADLEKKIATLDKEVITGTQKKPDTTLATMKTTLYQLELDEKGLKQTLQDSNPRLMRVREQVADARRALEELEKDSESFSYAPNPLFLKLEEDLLRAKTSAIGLESLYQKNLVQRQEKQEEIDKLLDFQIELGRLEREIELAQRNLSNLRDKEEQARVIEDLKEKRISSINVAQGASLVEKPVKPKKPLIAAAFVLLGMIGGLALVGLAEHSRQTIRRPEEIERFLKLPVINEVAANPALSRLKSLNRRTLSSHRFRKLMQSGEQIESEILLGGQHHFSKKNQLNNTEGKCVGVAGVHDNCGGSTLAMLLSLACSSGEKHRIALVDFDAKKKSITKNLRLIATSDPRARRRRANEDAAEQRLPESIFREGNLTIIGADSEFANALNSGQSEQVAGVIQELRQTFDFIVFDLPPANRPGNLTSILGELDQLVLVIACEETDAKTAMRFVEQLDRMEVPITGVVLNKSKRYLPAWAERLLG